MATAVAAKIPETDGLQNILSLFQALAPQFGSGKQTTTSSGVDTTSAGGTSNTVATGTIDPAVKAQSDALIQSLLQLGNSDAVDAQVSSILQKAKEAFGVNIGNSLGAGNRAYSDTTLQRLASDAVSRASAEAASAKLQFQSSIQDKVASLVNTQLQATKGATTAQTENKTTTEAATKSATQQTAATPAGKGASALGLGLTGYSAVKKLLDRKKLLDPASFSKAGGAIDTVSGLSTSELSNIFSGGAPVTDVLGSMAFPAAPGGFNLLASANDGTFSAGLANNIFSTTAEPFTDVTSVLAPTAATFAAEGAPLLADAATSAVPAISGTTIASDIGTASQFQGAADVGSDIIAGGAPLLDAFGAAATPSVAAAVSDAVDTGQLFGSIADTGPDFAGQLFDSAGNLSTALSSGEDVASNLFNIGGQSIGSFGQIGSAINIGQDLLRGDIGQSIGDFLGGSIVGDVVGAASVICTELHRQGIMSHELYQRDILFARNNLSPIMLRGYRFWAISVVKGMRKSKLLTSICAFLAIKRAESLHSSKFCFGKLFRMVFEPACYLLGLFVKEPDYSVLYEGLDNG